MASNTTIVFVPGAWHSPEIFDEVAAGLHDAGYRTDYVRLASVGAIPPLKDMNPDVKIIRAHLHRAIDQGQKVVIVAHSYGGVPATEAAYGLDYETRQKGGKAGGVVHLFYMCAFILPAGQSLGSALGWQDPPWHRVSDDQTKVSPDNPRQIFYNDLEEDHAQKYVAKLQHHSYQVFSSELSHDTWRIIPSTYLYCPKDNAIPLGLQEMMVNKFTKGVTIRTETVDAGHSPFLSKPNETVAAIKRAVEA